MHGVQRKKKASRRMSRKHLWRVGGHEYFGDILTIDDKEKWDDKVRTQYQLARKYHPDRNPEGRDVFEKIQRAYELLSSARPQAITGPDPVSIDLLLRTQCLLFRRFKSELAPYKYAGYPLLLQSLKLTELHSLSKNTHILVNAAHLAYLTCLCCALNARELTRVKGVERMSKLLIECMCTVTNNTERSHPNIQIASHLLHSLAGLAAFEAARNRMAQIPALANELVRSTALLQAPKTIHYSLEAIGRMTVDRRLQCMLFYMDFSLCRALLLQYDEGLNNITEKSEAENSDGTSNEVPQPQAARASKSAREKMCKLKQIILPNLGHGLFLEWVVISQAKSWHLHRMILYAYPCLQ